MAALRLQVGSLGTNLSVILCIVLLSIRLNCVFYAALSIQSLYWPAVKLRMKNINRFKHWCHKASALRMRLGGNIVYIKDLVCVALTDFHSATVVLMNRRKMPLHPFDPRSVLRKIAVAWKALLSSVRASRKAAYDTPPGVFDVYAFAQLL